MKLKNAKTDCFAYQPTKCGILHENDCIKCKFYKTRSQYIADDKKSKKGLKF